MKTTNTSKKGFTLIELLVVIAIIGILSSIVVISLSTARNKGSDAAVKETMANMRSQAENYFNENNYSYAGVCAAANTVTPAGVSTLLDAANRAAAGLNAVVNDANVAGDYGNTTCHDSATAWAAEAPMRGSVTGAPSMWCVDSTGKSAPTTANLTDSSGANQFVCP